MNYSGEDQAAKLEKTVLTPLRVRFSKIFGRYTLEKMEVDMRFIGYFNDELELQVTTSILGQSRNQIYTVDIANIPANWRGHFINEMRWKWLAGVISRKWPIKMKTVSRKFALDHWALLPTFDKVPPGYEVTMFTSIPGNEPGIRPLK